ncbi:MAG: hypothetical protein DRJ31_02705 [Candidatus Methanomethylicota archaeon]|uniref:Proteasome assembly chaperone family protein n=1 Tax=Thermoproteota archaeon TaxID=2056631 RepID=A0A497ETM5_9CREN|nr:MAG: hypothetical protein DRJ31_02705 [Candidatus Verstraetearchaeota archaeon]
MSVKFKFIRDVRANKPYMLVGFPGIAYVAKVAADYLIEKLDAELFAEVYSHAFPSFVIVRDNGIIEPLKVELYYSNSDGKDIILVTGNTQPATPEGQHELVDAIVNEVFKRYSISKVYAMAAYVVERRVGEPKVYGAVTDSSILKSLEKYGVIPMSGGSISGANGIILSYAKALEIPGACLLSETEAYTYYGYVADVKAAEALLKVVTSIVGISIDMADIEARAKEFEEMLRRFKEAEEKALKELQERTWYRGPTYIR